VSFGIGAEEFGALIGPNGAGKSTLLYALMGYLKPISGKILLQDKELQSYRRAAMARLLAFVPQESKSDFDHSVYETVLMGRYPYLGILRAHSDADRRVVDEVLEMLNLASLRQRWLSELSGGEKQRVYIARALVQETPCILLDESLSQLDINHQIEIMNLLKSISRDQHKTILIVSHNLNLAANHADKLFFLKGGSLLSSGDPAKMMQSSHLSELFGVNLQTQINPNSGRPNIIYP
nr:ABC transporter ATP-binding protein [Candidatus Cloacimonadota bacterium]